MVAYFLNACDVCRTSSGVIPGAGSIRSPWGNNGNALTARCVYQELAGVLLNSNHPAPEPEEIGLQFRQRNGWTLACWTENGELVALCCDRLLDERQFREEMVNLFKWMPAFQELGMFYLWYQAEPVPRRCNRHSNCDEADQIAKERGKDGARHCNDECCEDCFGN